MIQKPMSQNHNRKGSSILTIVILILCIIGALVFGGMTVLQMKNRSAAQNALVQMQQIQTVSEQEAHSASRYDALWELGLDVPEREIDFEGLQMSNPHIYAWIYVPGTSVDYPVLQHPTDDTYYLNHNIDGSVGYPGCIYSEPSVNTMDFTDYNTVLYGHNMRNGTMFATLHRYEDRTFFDENRYVYLYTPDKVYAYEIFATYTYSDRHLLKGIDISTREQFGAYLEQIYDARGLSNNFAEDITVTADHHILTLSTCTAQDTKRYLVQAVLLNEAKDE